MFILLTITIEIAMLFTGQSTRSSGQDRKVCLLDAYYLNY